MSDTVLNKLVERLRRGDDKAFSVIYDKTYKSVFFTAYKILGDKQLAEDVTQETYLSAITKLDAYQSDTNFCGWLITIARRLAINCYNKEKRSVYVDFSENENCFSSEKQGGFDEGGLFEEARRLLSDDEYQIVTLCAVAGYKRREVAQIMQMPIGTVTWKYNEAIKKLKKYYGEEL